MEPIINPLWIYLISRLDSIKNLFDIVLTISAILSLFSMVYYFYARNTTDEFYQTTYARIKQDAIHNAKRVKEMFGNYVDDLDVILKDKDDKERLTKLREIADNCCTVLTNIHEEERQLNERVKLETKHTESLKKLFMRSSIVFCVTLVLKALIPSSTVGYQILASNYITIDNLDLAKNTSKEAIEFVIQSIVTAIQNIKQ